MVGAFTDANRIFLPVSSFALFVIIVGYYPYFDNADWGIAANRWLSLPIDNWIPKIFADQLWAGWVEVPMLGDWHSSDRPPLQTGIYLLFYPFAEADGLLYQAVSSIFQAIAFIPVVLILRSIGLSKLAPFGIFALGMTSLMAVHTLFVWPKLLSVAYLLILYLVVMTPFRDGISRLWVKSLIVGSAAAFAMLSHGGAIFALLAIAVVYVLRYNNQLFSVQGARSMVRRYMASLAVFLAIYAPWVLYQRYVDPPGDRLTKWHIAGMIDINGMTLSQALATAYGNLTLSAWVDGRVDNLKMVVGSSLNFFHDFFKILEIQLIGSNGQSMPPLVLTSFHETFYSLWWFSPLLAGVIWLIRQKWYKTIGVSAEITWLGATAILALLVWCILMFIPGSTKIHQGNFFAWMALFMFSAALLWQTSKTLFGLCVAFNLFIFAKFYVLDRHVNGLNIDLEYLAISLFGFCLFVASSLVQGRTSMDSANRICMSQTIKSNA